MADKKKFKKFKTPVFRVSFPQLFEAESYEGGAPKFSLTAIWEPGKFSEGEKKLWKEIMTALEEEAQDRFKKSLKELKALNGEGAGYKLVPRDGKTKSHAGYGEGKVFANLSTKIRPGVVDRNRNEISPEMDNADEIYPGCYARATISIYSFNNVGKGIAMGLQNIQKIRDGDRLDTKTKAEDDFAEDDFEDLGIDLGDMSSDKNLGF